MHLEHFVFPEEPVFAEKIQDVKAVYLKVLLYAVHFVQDVQQGLFPVQDVHLKQHFFEVCLQKQVSQKGLHFEQGE